MELKFDLGEALSQAAHAAGEVAKDASATVKSAAKGVANAAEGAGNTIIDTAASASEAVGSAMCSAAEGVSSAGEQIASSDAGKAIAGAANAVGGIAVGAAMGLAQGASSLASDAASTVEGGINAIKENSFSARLRKARIKGFRDGIKQGAYLAGEKRYNFIYAYVATLCFLMRCDGDFSQEEQEWLEDGLDYLKLNGGLPDDVKAKVQAIADDEDLSFDRIKDCLDNVSIVSLGSIAEQLQFAAAADGQVTEEEEHACRLFADYMAARAACVAVDESWAEQAVEKSVREYGENLKIFKGADHRFATLGHDPVLGLVFGTSNIMTNSITCVKDANVFGIGARIPATYSVSYDAFGKNPLIGAPTGTVEMLVAAGRRVVSEPDAAAAALIKQLIHVGTDLYTPCGIQFPFANLVLDKAHTEALTKYVNTGDVLKVGMQAGMTVLINWLIAALHGCSLIFKDDGSDYCTEMYQARTKKIILISDTIATSSSVVQASITKNPKCLDLGGAAVLVYRLFSDARFVAKLKEEFLQSKLDKIYDERAKGLL